MGSEHPTSEIGVEAAALLGPARLAYFTPVREYPPLADRKAASLLLANALMTGVLLSFAQIVTATLSSPHPVAAWVARIGLASWAVAVVAGVWRAMFALTLPMPKLPPASLAYFPDIAGLAVEEYRRRVKALTHEEALLHILHYNYSVARLSVTKFRAVRISIHCLWAGIVSWMVLLLAMGFGVR